MRIKNIRKILKIAGIVLLVVLALAACVFFGLRAAARRRAYNVETLSLETVKALEISKCDKLMIVAHPDDETLWGGAHLLKGGYLVVCVTNGRNEERRAEYISVVEKSGNVPLILEYPDKVFGKRDEWEEVYDKITADVELLVGLKDWDMIVTHNPDGEYGHIHHKMTNKIVTDVCDSKKPSGKLYYFGKYYRAADLPDVKDKLTTITPEELKAKEELMDMYVSQKNTLTKLGHMTFYEEWTEYKGSK